MLGRQKRHKKPEAELDITSFLNLMIVLVPVLLMMMVFSKITVIELSLPGLEVAGDGGDIENQHIELVVTPQGSAVYFPSGYLVEQIPAVTNEGDSSYHNDWDKIQFILKQIKQTLLAKGIEKDDIVLMIDDSLDYQSVITLIEQVRSYKDVVAASVVDAALFPEVSFAEAPPSMASLDWTATPSSPMEYAQ